MISVSVIIPNYNHAAYLEERIASVLNQTYQDFELIILDDCSTDHSKKIIDQFRHHPKVSHIIYNSENSGSSFIQWQKGIEIASGEWIWIAESDDWCENSLLQELVDGVNSHPSANIGYCQSIMFKDNEILWQSTERLLNTFEEGGIFVKHRMLKGNAIYNASMCIFKKQAYFNISQEFTKYKFCGDWLFWIEIALQGNVFISGKTLNYFRKHENDVSTSAFHSGLNYEEHFQLLEYLEKQQFVTKTQINCILKAKHKQFRIDKKINNLNRKRINKKFKDLLGFHYYTISIWYYKWLLKKWIKAFLS